MRATTSALRDGGKVERPVPDFTTVTEAPGHCATRDQASILYARYHLASQHARNRVVLELACGTGIGLGLLAAGARSVVAGDIEEANCRIASQTYEDDARITIRRLDAESLPFPDRSFEVVILFEALYYLPRPERFFSEARRVLRPGGVLLISTVNCEWPGFNPSPFSTKYFNARELVESLAKHDFQIRLLAGFPEDTSGVIRGCVSLIRRVAVRLRLIPKTMKGKEWLKRLFYGKLTPIPRRLTERMFEPEPLVEVNASMDLRRYRFLYAIGTLSGSKEAAQ